MQKELSALVAALDRLDETAQLKYLADAYPDQVAFSTSLSIKNQAITHMIFSNHLNIKVFTLDTGRHFEETYKTLDYTMKKYEKPIFTFFPQREAVEALATKKGLYSFYESIEDRKECCRIRKVEPLKRALRGNKIWITGIRAEQSENRKDVALASYDEGNNVIKINPLVNWTLDKLEAYVKANNVNLNPLYGKGFLSIGCRPCTRAVREGEDARAGRWWWENASKKECGLHE